MDWMISANGKKYDHAGAFAKWGFIDWTQKVNYRVDDVVYIYCTKPYQKVMYKCKVTEINKNFLDCQDDKEFWSDKNQYNQSKTGKFARFELIEKIDSDELKLDKLQQHGLNQAPQKAIKVPQVLYEYLEKYFQEYNSNELYADSVGAVSNYHEGHAVSVKVNRFERSSIARGKCIEHFGCKCSVCGLDFEKKYGNVGKGFIHVHHLKPLYTIGQDYIVDYKKDLIPVCPNCHAMIHRLDESERTNLVTIKNVLKIK